ncbi:hypothetical protein PYCC9005_000244 [Savitreella phatthalungensis]
MVDRDTGSRPPTTINFELKDRSKTTSTMATPMTGEDLTRITSTKKSVMGSPSMDVETGETCTLHDSDALNRMGYSQELTRKFSFLSMLCLAFSILGTWPTLAQSMGAALSQGGSITILWGLILVFLCNLCITSSLGELASAFPTSLGQAFYVAQILPRDSLSARFLSYLTAWINTAGWIALNASQTAFMTSFLIGMKLLFDEDWSGASKGWISFLVYLGLTAAGTLFNIVICKRDSHLPLFNKLITAQNLVLLFVFSLGLLVATGVRQDTHFRSGRFVFGNWSNTGGWPDGVAFLLGLVQAGFGLTAFDSVIHLIEEIPDPQRTAPRILNLSVVIGTLTGFFFMVVCLFCLQSEDNVQNSATGLPFMQLCKDAMGLVLSAALLANYIVNGIFQAFVIATTSSRLTWSFARDGGFPYAAYFSRVDPYWLVPVRATLLQGVIVGLIGILYLCSNQTLTAILSVSTIALTISYALPPACLLVVGRRVLRLQKGPYYLGDGFLGYLTNIVTVIYCAITTVFFFFPSSPNPAAADMNYAIAVFAVVCMLAAVFWVFVGRKRFLKETHSLASFLTTSTSGQHLPSADTLGCEERGVSRHGGVSL